MNQPNDIDWKKFLDCLKESATKSTDIAELVFYISIGDYINAAAKLAELVEAGDPYVEKCLEE